MCTRHINGPLFFYITGLLCSKISGRSAQNLVEKMCVKVGNHFVVRTLPAKESEIEDLEGIEGEEAAVV